MERLDIEVSGGCQCGAVRFAIAGPLVDVSLCHCRMCQKATGGLFGIYAAVENKYLEWTRGTVAYFKSSSAASRGFCRDCGTPLTFEWTRTRTAISVGSFDEPNALMPDFALEVANMHPALPGIASVREEPMADTPEAEAVYAELKNYQHPDHDTDDWPPKEESKP